MPVSTSQIGQFQAPDVTETGKVKNRPIETALQAFEVYQRFERDNLMRAVRNKQIADAYNGSQPYEQKKLNDVGQGWRSNWSVLALSLTVNRIKPRILKAINDQKYLTQSELPSGFEDGSDKTEKFRNAMTKLIRKWSGWNDYLDQLISEDVLYGYTGAVHLDMFNWRPRTFRQEELLFDEQTSQFAGRLVCFVVKTDYYIHEILEMLQDWETAEDLGYNVANLVNAVKMAAPPRMNLAYDPRQLADMVREANVYYTYHRSAKMIETAHVFVLNYEGKVDHWWVNRTSALSSKQGAKESGAAAHSGEKSGRLPEDKIELFSGEAICKSMEDLITLFTFEPGNNRLFGSKGMGRWLFNAALAMDKVVNAFLDGFYLSQLMAGEFDAGKVAQIQPQVRNPFFIVPEGFTPLGQQIKIDLSSYQFLVNQVQHIMDQIAGTYMPDQNEEAGQPPETATQASIDSEREQEISTSVENRFWTQLQLSVGAMQRRACGKDNMNAAIAHSKAKKKALKDGKKIVTSDVMELMESISDKAIDAYAVEPDLPERVDRDAVMMIVELMEKGLTAEEIIVLANQPSSRYNTNVDAQENQKFLMFWATMGKGNPYFDQAKGNEKAGVASIGPDLTGELYIKQPDQTTQVEQTRQQQAEMIPMTQGQPVPVSPRDDHQTHLAFLEPQLTQMLQQMAQSPPLTIPDPMIKTVGLGLKHAEDHLNSMLQTGMTKQDLAQPLKQLKQGQQELQKIVQAKQKAMQEHQQLMAQQQAQQAAQSAQQGPGPSGPFPEMSVDPAQLAQMKAQAQQKAQQQTQAPPQQGPPRPGTPQEAAKLPPGTHFVDPKGKVRRRP